MSNTSAMTPSHSDKIEIGEPSSYEHMEQALSRVVARAGEDTREVDSTEVHLLPMNTNENDALSKVKSGSSEACPSGAIGSLQKGKELSAPLSQDGESSTVPNSKESYTSSNGSESSAGMPKTQLPELEPHAEVGSTAFSRTTNLGDKDTCSFPGPTETEAPLASQSNPKQSSHTPLMSCSNHALGDVALFSEESLKSGTELSGPPRVIHTDISSKDVASHSPSTSSPQMQAAVGSPRSRPGTSLRRGKWTMEEEAYVARVIQDFNSGFLNAPAGTTLRTYLSDKLQCDPMRITKKFTGDACIGKRVFHPAVRSTGNAATIDKAQAELDALERRWRRRLEMQQRDSAKKAAASAAAGNSPSQAGRGHGLIQGVPVALLSGTGAHDTGSSGGQHLQQNVVTQAASWLDRANAILKGNRAEGIEMAQRGAFGDAQQSGQSFDSMPNSEIENQMMEVQRLIYEGPLIQQTTAGLPHLLNHSGQANQSSEALASSHSIEQNLPNEPADKRMRTTASLSGEEDAEALVGFLRSVRAAAGQESSN